MPRNRHSRELDERTCAMICTVSAAMVGVCLTGVSLLQVATSFSHASTIVDDLLSFDSVLFLIATLTSYFALRVQASNRIHALERLADGAFISAMILLTAACFLITYALHL